MSDAQVKKDLEALIKVFNDEWARGPMSEFRHKVSLTVEDQAASMARGYKDAMATRKKGQYPTISADDFLKEAKKHIPKMYNKWHKGSDPDITVLKAHSDKNKYIVVSLKSEANSDFFVYAKQLGVDYVNSRLRDAKKAQLGGADKEYKRREATGELTDKQKGNVGYLARASEVGKFKSGWNKAHREDSTVGTVRLLAITDYLSKTKYGGFVDSGQFKTLRNRYPGLKAKFTTTGMRKSKGKAVGTIAIREGMTVDMDFVPTSKNFSGSEIRDFGKITKKGSIAYHLYHAMLRWVKKQDWKGKKGSDTIEQASRKIARASVLTTITKNGKRRSTGAKRQEVKRPKKNKSKGIGRAKKTSVRSVAPAVKTVSATKRGTNAGNQQGASLYTVMAMISQKLPETVRKNMGEPRLENQTGRFANSVKMTDVIQTPQGYPSFGYTYAKEPYQVYETGSSGNWATPERDPRRLIDASIREIAAGFALGRFYTRRQ